MNRLVAILIFLLFTTALCNAQFKKQLDSLCVLCNNSASDSDKVVALGKLANLYYTYKLNTKGDSVLHEQLLIAELSDNNNLILAALFGEAITNISESATAESYDKTVAFLQKGIDYAKSQGQYDYTSLGYIRMANIMRSRGQTDKALYNATQALQLLPNINSDSIKAEVYIELGNSYLAKGEAVSAVRNYNNAFDIALKLKSIPLQSNIYHSFAEMYLIFLESPDIAKDFLKKSLKIDKEHNYLEGLIRDYYDLARVTYEKIYLEKSIKLSDSLNYNKYILQAKRLMLNYYIIVEKNSYKALHYLEAEPDLKESYINPGMGNYYQKVGHIFYYSQKFDSALNYYKLAEYDFLKNFDDNRTNSLFKNIASTYQKINEIPHAIAYYLKSLLLSKKLKDIRSIVSISTALSIIYEQKGDFQQAFMYSKNAKENKDSLDKLSKARDIALLDVDRETRRHEDELRREEEKLYDKRYLQYMLITIVIVIVFIVMLVIGMFPVSKITIKMFGYFFFISLFEFIVLLIDNSFLANLTHNEPLKLWMIKIVLIASLVPLQHFMEHSLIQFLESRKLLKARTHFSFKTLWNRLKKPAPVTDAGIEEDTAVL